MKQILNFLHSKTFVIIFSIFVLTFLPYTHTVMVVAKDLSSPSFIVRDPLIGTGGGFYSSGTFKMFGSGDTTLTGYSTSALYIGEFGFLYFPGNAIVVPPDDDDDNGGGGGHSLNPNYIPGLPGSCAKVADFNCDGYVNILDLSILLYYTDKTGSIIVPYDLSRDGLIDLEDISILFYYWDF